MGVLAISDETNEWFVFPGASNLRICKGGFLQLDAYGRTVRCFFVFW